MTLVTATDSKLNIRQDMFAKNVAATGNATQAYRDAGYKASTPNTAEVNASKLLSNPKVKLAVERYRADIEAASKVDQAFVLQRLVHFATNAEVESNAVRATELLGKHLRMFVDVSESTVHHDLRELQAHSLSDLKRMIAAMDEPAAIEGEVTVLEDE